MRLRPTTQTPCASTKFSLKIQAFRLLSQTPSVQESPCTWIRRAAVRKLNNQSVLANIAKNDGDKDVRIEAAYRIKDQSVLVELAKNDKEIRARISSKLAGQYAQLILLDIINDEDASEHAIFSAIKNLTDQSALSNIVLNADLRSHNAGHARIAAYERITEPSIIANIKEIELKDCQKGKHDFK